MSNSISIRSIKLPPLSQINWVKVALSVALVGLIGYAYFGQHAERDWTCFDWLKWHWSAQSLSNYSHGPLIPLIASGLMWWKRDQLFAVVRQPMPQAAWIIVVSMAVYYVGIKAVRPQLAVGSFILLLYGLALSFWGRDLFRVVFFPITFLLLMIPLSFLEEQVGVPLRYLMASASTGLLNFLGVETIRVGTGLYSPTGIFKLDVAAPCSGIRSLMALMTVTAAFGYVTQRVQWKRWVLFLSAMPLAVLGNMARVTSVAVVSHVYGEKFGTTEYHDAAGFIVYGVALTAMVALGFMLDFPYRRVVNSWLRPPQAPENPDDKPLPPIEQRETL